MDIINTNNTYNKQNLISINNNSNIHKFKDKGNSNEYFVTNIKKDKLSITEIKTPQKEVLTNMDLSIESHDGTQISRIPSSYKGEKEYRSPFFMNTNGIQNTESEALETKRVIENITGEDITLFYNQSNGVLVDGLEAFSELTDSDILKFASKYANSINSKDKSSYTLKEFLTQPLIKTMFNLVEIAKKDTIEETIARDINAVLKTGKSPQITVHSQGAAIYADALNLVKQQLLKENEGDIDKTAKEMSYISVLSIGGFASINHFPKEINLTTIENKINNKEGIDPVSYIAGNNMEGKNSVLEKTIQATINTRDVIIPLVSNATKNDGNPLLSHNAQNGYLDKTIVEKEYKTFVERAKMGEEQN